MPPACFNRHMPSPALHLPYLYPEGGHGRLYRAPALLPLFTWREAPLWERRRPRRHPRVHWYHHCRRSSTSNRIADVASLREGGGTPPPPMASHPTANHESIAIIFADRAHAWERRRPRHPASPLVSFPRCPKAPADTVLFREVDFATPVSVTQLTLTLHS